MSRPNSLFSQFGVELEYMLVNVDSLDVVPIADRLLHRDYEQRKNERNWGGLRISNELVLHVLELKTDGPAPGLEGLGGEFQKGIVSINTHLANEGVRLLPGAMHPWMEPHRETVIWPHGNRDIYQAFDRIFDCRGHGWSNLQSTHLNLPFSGEREFVRLHEALRWILPLVPAIAASSPFLEGRAGGLLDHRLASYRENCRRIPSITGRVVPEKVASMSDYHTRILDRITADLNPLDPERILDAEWVNARGAIARFDRGTIELRVMDVQECPAADLAILQFFVALLRDLTSDSGAERLSHFNDGHGTLTDLFDRSIELGMATPFKDSTWISALGLEAVEVSTLGDALWVLFERLSSSIEQPDIFRQMLVEGNLATRLLRSAGTSPTRPALRELYGELADCLGEGRLFRL